MIQQDMNHLAQAYILAGDAEACYSRAMTLAQGILCSGLGTRPCGECQDCRKVSRGVHPDITVVTRLTDDKGKPKREIVVAQIRDIVATAPVLPMEAERKVYLIREAGLMNANAQNAFLKLLEDPPSFAYFILLVQQADQLLETVRSRCVLLRENGEEAINPSAEEMAARYLDIAASGNPLAVLSFTTEYGEKTIEEMREFVTAVQLRLTDMLCGRTDNCVLGQKELLRLTGLMNTARQYLRFTVGVKHVLGLLSVETIPNIEGI